jgi:hypothetical protein
MQQTRYMQMQLQQQQQALRMQQQLQSSGYSSPYSNGGSNLASPHLYGPMQPFTTPPLSSMLGMNDLRTDDVNRTEPQWESRDMYRRQQCKYQKNQHS